jgi:hypothetical protein
MKTCEFVVTQIQVLELLERLEDFLLYGLYTVVIHDDGLKFLQAGEISTTKRGDVVVGDDDVDGVFTDVARYGSQTYVLADSLFGDTDTSIWA